MKLRVNASLDESSASSDEIDSFDQSFVSQVIFDLVSCVFCSHQVIPVRMFVYIRLIFEVFYRIINARCIFFGLFNIFNWY